MLIYSGLSDSRGKMISKVFKKFWIFHLVAIATGSYLAAQTISAFLGTRLQGTRRVSSEGRLPTQGLKEKQLPSLEDYEVVLRRNIFNSAQADTGPLNAEEAGGGIIDPNTPAVKSLLPVKLLGVMVVGDGMNRYSSAVISGGSGGEADAYFVQDLEKTFSPGVTLVKVAKDRIEFVNKGRMEYVEMEGAEAGPSLFRSAEEVHGGRQGAPFVETAEVGAPGVESVASEGDHFTIDQREVDEALANLDRLVTEVRIVPILKGGETAGLKVVSVKPGSLFAKLGIQRGDVLKKINGIDLDVRRGMLIFSELKDQKSLTVDLVRRGQNKSLEYDIR